jgi:predicted RNA-binding protein with PUA-like domain
LDPRFKNSQPDGICGGLNFPKVKSAASSRIFFARLLARKSVRYWLMKSEPDDVSIDDLAETPAQTTAWTGVRNYQARNFMLDEMRAGDHAFFYHSSCEQPGIAGIVKVVSRAYPDATQFDSNSPYFDVKANRAKPRWFNVDVKLVKKTRLIGLTELRRYSELTSMRVLQKGNRLSITPVSESEWNFITRSLT